MGLERYGLKLDYSFFGTINYTIVLHANLVWEPTYRRLKNGVIGERLRMQIRKIVLMMFGALLLITNGVSAHHEEFYPINWGDSMEYHVNIDAFKPKYFQKFPYGFISVGCERVSEVISFDYDDKDLKKATKAIKKTKINKDLLAFLVLCDAISDIRHPPKKEIMKYSKMAKAYGVAYKLSVRLSLGGDADLRFFLNEAAILKVASNKATTMFDNPDERTKWLLKYIFLVRHPSKYGSSECRYEIGDSWCAKNGNGKPYAYLTSCLKLDIPSFDFSLYPFPGWRRDSLLGSDFNVKMTEFLNKIVYLHITLSPDMTKSVNGERDYYGRYIFTVQNDADAFHMGGAEYLIHLSKENKNPFEFMDNVAVLSGYYKVFDINGPRQGYMSVNLRPVDVD